MGLAGLVRIGACRRLMGLLVFSVYRRYDGSFTDVRKGVLQ